LDHDAVHSGAGDWHADMPVLDPNANMSWHIDNRFLPGTMYEKTRDPEGTLSTFPAIATVLMGVLTGEWLKANSQISDQAKAMNLGHSSRRFAGVLIAGAALIVAGQLWGICFPINKKLWTRSFVRFSGDARRFASPPIIGSMTSNSTVEHGQSRLWSSEPMRSQPMPWLRSCRAYSSTAYR
jgi:hypothetical protein